MHTLTYVYMNGSLEKNGIYLHTCEVRCCVAMLDGGCGEDLAYFS